MEWIDRIWSTASSVERADTGIYCGPRYSLISRMAYDLGAGSRAILRHFGWNDVDNACEAPSVLAISPTDSDMC